MFKNFLYYFLTEDGKSYYVDNKTVKTSAVPKALTNTPDGWQEVGIGYERDLKKLGIVRSFSLPLQAVKLVRKILRTIIFTKNIEEKVFLLIQKLQVTVSDPTYRFLYKYFYKGEIDLSQYTYQDITDKFTITEAGTFSKVKANEGTDYEIDIDSDPEVVKIKMDGFNFDQTANWVVSEMQLPASVPFILSFINLEGTSTGDVFAQTLEGIGDDSFFLKNVGTAPVTFQLTGSIVFTAGPVLQEVQIGLDKLDANNNVTSLQLRVIDPATENTVYTEDYNLSITLNTNEYLRIFIHTVRQVGGAPGNNDAYINLQETRFKATYKTKYRNTLINALKPSTVFKRLTAKIAGSEIYCDTSYVEQFDHLLLTSGDAIRGIAGAKIKTNLNDFSDFMRVEAGAGQSIENNKILFNAYTYFFNQDNVVSLGEASGLKVYPANDLMGNTLKIGYPVQQIDDVNGKYSFNNTHTYSSPKVRNVKELNYVCPYIADPYYIEITRINLDGKTTTDDQADNTVFILNTIQKQQSINVTFDTFFALFVMAIAGGADLIDLFPAGGTFTITGDNAGTYSVNTAVAVDGNLLVFTGGPFNSLTTSQVSIDLIFGTRILRRVTYDSITGIPDTELIFNIEDLTPKRLVLRQANMFNSLFYGHAGQKLKFETTEKNAGLTTQRGTVYIKENADYTIGTDILFKPWYFEFDTIVPVNLVDILEENINRCFSFTWYGYTFKGFLVKAGISPNDNKVQSFKLLCAPDSDLTKLINANG